MPRASPELPGAAAVKHVLAHRGHEISQTEASSLAVSLREGNIPHELLRPDPTRRNHAASRFDSG